jgi:hypothetical protein
MKTLRRRIESNAALLAGAVVAVLNIIAITRVWQPSGTTLAAVNAAAAAVLAFLVQAVPGIRSRRIRRDYLLRARQQPLQVMGSAGGITGEVVGRDDLCEVLVAALRDRGRRRPQIVVGSVESGKTALLVRLTTMLAERGFLPVPVRLIDARESLDFIELARTRFLADTDSAVLSEADGEKIWRQLRSNDRIAVLADGLEYALLGTSAEQDRDDVIRAAIARANRDRVPLIITSRPHDPLRASGAAILPLEELSYEAALAYLSDAPLTDERRLSWIVDTADIVETPVYLQITRDLQGAGLLDPSSAGHGIVLDTRGADRFRLRLSILQTWERALVAGYLRENVPLSRPERQAAIEHLSALACAGIKRDRLDVDLYYDLEPQLEAEVRRRLAALDSYAPRPSGITNMDVRLGAMWAAQLDLVELHGSRVRFPHSLMQAYFGSRLLSAAMTAPGYCEAALSFPCPGREFLIALVLRSRDFADPVPVDQDRAQPKAGKGRRSGQPPARLARPGAVTLLREAAQSRDDVGILGIYAAALEIDCSVADPAHNAIAQEIAERWFRIHGQDPRTLEAAKLDLVRRFGIAARMIDERRRRGDPAAGEPAYRHLYYIGCGEGSRRVQIAIAQEIVDGGDAAYSALAVAAPCAVCEAERAGRLNIDRFGSASSSESRSGQTHVMSAWLAPMLVGSMGVDGDGRASDQRGEQARADLDQWLRHLRWEERRPGEEALPISLQIALAQGFKYAANRRPAVPDTRQEVRMYLAEQALDMLAGSSYWFVQLTLIQTLCLLSLSDESRPSGRPYDARPEALVQHWLDIAGRASADHSRESGATEVHPLVQEGAYLAVMALKTGRPQSYCWLDEAEVVSQIGSRNTGPVQVHRRHRLWIPPSAGWTALSDRAQQLVADVSLLLNLTDRGDHPRDVERRLKRANRRDLPPCITHYRSALMPERTVGTSASSAPGMSCVQGCPFGLCPYPPKGSLPSRQELSEAFCHEQRALAGERFLRRAAVPWALMASARLQRFWTEMADRAAGS